MSRSMFATGASVHRSCSCRLGDFHLTPGSIRCFEALDLRDVTLVAYSMSSGEAVRYLSRHGLEAYFARPVPRAHYAFPDQDGRQSAGRGRRGFRRGARGDSEGLPAGLAAGFKVFLDEGVSEELKTWARGLMLQCSLKALIDCQHAFTSTDFRPELMRLTLPTLVIQGDADRSAPAALTGRRTADLVTGAEYRIYPGAPHGLVFTHTERLNADIAAFAKP